MYETWRFLQALINDMAGIREPDDTHQDPDITHEDLDDIDGDLDDVPDAEMVQMLRRLSLPAGGGDFSTERRRQDFSAERCRDFSKDLRRRRGSLNGAGMSFNGPLDTPDLSKPEVDEPEMAPTPPLPDFVPSSTRRGHGVPDLVRRRRSTFRLDSQWIQGSKENLKGSRESLPVAVAPKGRRRWSCSNMDEIDGGGMVYPQGRNWSPLGEEDEGAVSPSSEEGPCWSPKITQERTWSPDEMGQGGVWAPALDECAHNPRAYDNISLRRAKSWKNCGTDLARVSGLRNKSVPHHMDSRYAELPAEPRRHSIAVEEMCYGAQRKGLVERKGVVERKVATDRKVVVERKVGEGRGKGLVADVFVLLTLAGAAYCVNKLRSLLS